jgi:transcriptional regulator GlxA family with amidase domain
MSVRKFSSTMLDTNSAYITTDDQQTKIINIGFILLENFSMMSFTAAVDVLVTANLVQSNTLFKVSSYALKTASITSDLGIDITTSSKLSELKLMNNYELDMLIVCGGLRCSLSANTKLNQILKAAHKHNVILGSIWNGVIALAQANVLQEQICALHVDNHALMQEHYPSVNLSDQSFISDTNHISCADALGALDMMLHMVESITGPAVTRAVKEILSCNRSREGCEDRLNQFGDNEQLPAVLRSAIQLMNSNIEEPIAIDEMASYLQTNRRQLERLFKQYLNTSPSRHYLEIRLTCARRLLIQSSDSITNIAIASGFVSSNHFSNCFSQYFKIPPSACRKRKED